mgnify:CR=1 FL=1
MGILFRNFYAPGNLPDSNAACKFDRMVYALYGLTEEEIRDGQRIVLENWDKLVRSGSVPAPEPVEMA